MKEVIREVKIDIGYILNQAIHGDSPEMQKSIDRLKVYAEIFNLIDSIPEQNWEQRKDLAHDLGSFALTYSLNFGIIRQGKISIMLPNKYQLISQKGKLLTQAAVEGANGPTRKLIQVVDKYVELLKLDYLQEHPQLS